MPEDENLVPGAAPFPPPTLWGQWLNTAKCPPGAAWKTSAYPELWRDSALSLTPLFTHTHSPKAGSEQERLQPYFGAVQVPQGIEDPVRFAGAPEDLCDGGIPLQAQLLLRMALRERQRKLVPETRTQALGYGGISAGGFLGLSHPVPV